MPEFQVVQAAFAAHLRDPAAQAAPPDIEDRRMAIYRRLFFNNIQSFLSNAFPVLRQLYADADWQVLVRGFYARHRCRRPQFYQLAEEFLDYLAEEYESGPADRSQTDVATRHRQYSRASFCRCRCRYGGRTARRAGATVQRPAAACVGQGAAARRADLLLSRQATAQ